MSLVLTDEPGFDPSELWQVVPGGTPASGRLSTASFRPRSTKAASKLLLSKVLLVCRGSALQYLLTNLGGQQSEIPNRAAATYLNART